MNDGYPLEVGGVDDYPVKVGSMLLTMVEPHKGFEKAYNRWYERDHYYAGCMVGPFLFAGSRWVATRELKDLRWPAGSDGIARPTDSGSYVAIYWVEQGHHGDHFDHWARDQVRWLYANNRGFPERTHVHTVLFDHIGAVYRDPDPVPIDVALDHGYDGIVAAWFDAVDGDARELHSALSKELLPALVADSGIEIASSWTPSAGENDDKDVPMDLGTKAGGPERLCQLFFLHGDVRATLDRFHTYTNGVEQAGLGTTRLVAPFFRTVIGTDTYVDQLW
ncbi:MAG TPA: hypothetical protein VGQ20_03830 [Acidimicrobiales bacterium]|jgi:hypothetical protein|nr:hypothetical protein [Acidimicrobiales bacterium]